MSRRKMSPEDVVREHINLSILRAAKETANEQDRVFHEKRRENNLFFILETIHPSFYDTFASKLNVEELKNILERLDGTDLYEDFLKNFSNVTIVRILSSIWDFPTFLEKVETKKVNAFINSEADGWCLKKFSSFTFSERLEIFSRFSEKGVENFFEGMLNNVQYITEVSNFLKELDSGKIKQAEEIFQKICAIPASVFSKIFEIADSDAVSILLKKLDEDKITSICCGIEKEKMYLVLEKTNFKMMAACQNPFVICEKLTDMELQKLFTKLKEFPITASSIIPNFQYLEAFYHAVSAEDKVCILDDFLTSGDFGMLYEKLSKEEQDEIFELILGEDLSQEKAKLLRQQAVNFLKKKEKLSYFEKVTLRDLQSQMES